MNNQNNQNIFGENFDSQKNSSLPEEIKFSDNGEDGGSTFGRSPRRGSSPTPNRVLYVTAVVLLLSVAIIAAITSAANRSRKNPVETPEASSSISTPNSKPQASQSESTPESSIPSSESSTPGTEDVISKVPTFELPVSGTLAVPHDPELQVFSPTMQEYRVHTGIDINTTEGAPVYAAAKGEVTKVWNDPMMGWCLEITHEGNACTYYKNLSETLATGISKGASVRAGQLLGSVGDSAMMEVAQEPHLHFEITVNGKMEDPLDHFATDVIAQLGSDEGYEG